MCKSHLFDDTLSQPLSERTPQRSPKIVYHLSLHGSSRNIHPCKAARACFSVSDQTGRRWDFESAEGRAVSTGTLSESRSGNRARFALKRPLLPLLVDRGVLPTATLLPHIRDRAVVRDSTSTGSLFSRGVAILGATRMKVVQTALAPKGSEVPLRFGRLTDYP